MFPIRWTLVLPLALLLCGCSARQEAARPWRPLNVLLVTIDTLRADRLRCYGYTHVETPALDALAAGGALFEHAIAQTPLTPPSHASMFTGMYPYAHGVRNTGGFVLQSSANTLAEMLRERGWDTAAFIGASVLKKLFGFNQGFTVYDDEMPKPADGQTAREHPERSAAEVVDRAVAWLGRRSAKPFFLWVHVFDPHMPYDAPPPFKERYAGRPYDGEVAYTDQQLGRLFEAVRNAAPRDTLMVVLSDHGESLAEHGEYTHGIFLYDATLRIPLIMAGPGIPAGVRVSQQARTIDLLPTLLELLSGQAAAGFHGVSLAPAFHGRNVDTRFAYAETLYPKMNMGWSELRAVRTSRWKYIRAPRPELYDLARDPAETDNVIGRYPREAQELEAQLKTLTGKATEKVETALVDRKTVDQLKSLGYLGGFTPREFELTGQGIDPKDRIGILKIFETAVSEASTLPRARRVQLLQQALAEDGGNPSVYYHLGTLYEQSGHYDAAMKLYQSAVHKGIENGRLYSRIADLHLKAGRKDEAIAYYERAAQFNPSDVESQNNLATAYLEKGRIADAERVYQWVLATGEEHAPAYNGLGLIAIQRQDPANARAHFERAVQLNPDLVEAQLNLGLIYRMAGDIPRARRCFETFVAKAPRAQYGPMVARVQEELALMR